VQTNQATQANHPADAQLDEIETRLRLEGNDHLAYALRSLRVDHATARELLHGAITLTHAA